MASIAMEALEEAAIALRCIAKLAPPESEISELAGVAFRRTMEQHNDFDCDRECYKDARNGA